MSICARDASVISRISYYGKCINYILLCIGVYFIKKKEKYLLLESTLSHASDLFRDRPKGGTINTSDLAGEF